MGQRHNVVRHRGFSNDALGGAIAAERFCPEAAKTLGDCTASAQSFGHMRSLKSACGVKLLESHNDLGRHDLLGTLAHGRIFRGKIGPQQIRQLVDRFGNYALDFIWAHAGLMRVRDDVGKPQTKRARKTTWAPGTIRNDLFRKGYSIGKVPSTPF